MEHIKNIYFLGIGGIGMSALARYFKTKGYKVSGYDKTPSPLTEKLSREGIAVNYTDREDAIDEIFRDKTDTLVIYTPAIPKENIQKSFFLRSGFKLHKRAEVLGMISKSGKALCVAGTHGKTTVTTMLAWIMSNSAVGCNAFLGGISVNFGSNLVLNDHSDYIVVEADEFDRSFLHLEPEIALITAIDPDHLDIYGDEFALREAFEQFAGKVRKTGKLLVKKGIEIKKRPVDTTYAVGSPAGAYADNLRIIDGRYLFDYHGKNGIIKDVRLGFPGRVNVENATAAITIALEAGVTGEEIKASLPEFRGVVRRFNICAEGDVIYIDDYAHHPKEIEAVLTSVREMWPEKPLTVAFQPHLYTRTRDFHREFGEALSLADQVMLLDIYPAREEPIPGVDSRIIGEYVKVPLHYVSKQNFISLVKKEIREGIFMTLGAGDIDRLVPELTKLFSK